MKRLALLLVPCLLHASAPRKQYTIEQLKALKPPLAAQLYDGLPKAPGTPAVFSPTVTRKVLRKYKPIPKEISATQGKNVNISACLPPFPEIVIQFEEYKK